MSAVVFIHVPYLHSFALVKMNTLNIFGSFCFLRDHILMSAKYLLSDAINFFFSVKLYKAEFGF